METLPRPQIDVRQFGADRQPVVVIDGFSGMADRLRDQATKAEYQPGGAAYPGIRAWADPSYLDRRRGLMFEVLQKVFGIRRGIKLEASTFSLVTKRADDLSPGQRRPHYDGSEAGLIAVMHYLLGPESGGTAFYRHRATGFEAITPERQARYEDAAQAEDHSGEPGPAYHYGDNDRYEMIGEIEAQPDRFILYRGWSLHSGVIPKSASLSADPAKGRLTINMFLMGA